MHNLKNIAPSSCWPPIKSSGAAGRTPKAISSACTSPAASAQRPNDPDQLDGPPGLIPFYRCLFGTGRILKLDSVLQMWSKKPWIAGDNPFPQFTCHTFIDTSQDAASSLCCQGTVLAHAQLAACQDPRAFSIELHSSQFFIVNLSTLPDCKIPTCKQKYCGKQCFMIELLLSKQNIQWKAYKFITFGKFNLVLHYN